MKSGSDLSLMLYQLQWDPLQDQDRECCCCQVVQCAVQWDPLQDRDCCWCQVVQQTQTQTIAENMKFKKFKLSEGVGVKPIWVFFPYFPFFFSDASPQNLPRQDSSAF